VEEATTGALDPTRNERARIIRNPEVNPIGMEFLHQVAGDLAGADRPTPSE
jgi:hypothetical protein